MTHGWRTRCSNHPSSSPAIEIGRARIHCQAANASPRSIRTNSRVAPAIWDGNGVDEHVFIRGSPKGLGEPVPRRFLEALAGDGADRPRDRAAAGWNWPGR